MAWIGKLLELLTALPKLFSALSDLFSKVSDYFAKKKQDEIANEKKDQISTGVATGDTLPLEEAIGAQSPGSPAKDQDGVQVRPDKVH